MGDEAAAAAHTIVGPRPWWESWPVLALVVAAMTLPLLYPQIPPLVDLFGHMGRYRVELDLGQSPWLQRYFDYHWAAIGNLGVDVLVLLLGPLLGLEPAVKLIVIAIAPLTAVGFLWVAREVHGRIPPTAFFALPFIFGYPYLFGFVNFTLSVALAFLAFGLWLRLGRLDRTTLRGWLFVPISVLVFFCHTYGWGLLGLLCFSADAVRLHDRGRSWFQAGLEAAMHTSVMALPVIIMLIWRSEAHGGLTMGWFEWEIKWRWIYSALRDRWGFFDMASLAFAGLIFLYAIVSRKLTLSRNLAFSAIVLAISFIIIPRIVFGSAYADARLIPYLMAVALLAIRFRGATDARLAHFIAMLGLIFFAMRIAGNTASLALASEDQQAKLAALDYMPTGSRVASFFGLKCEEWWALPRNSHLGAMVIERRQGFSNDQWMMEGMNLLDLKYTDPGSFAYDPSEVVRPNNCHDGLHLQIDQALLQVPRDKFDFIWTIDAPPYHQDAVAGLQPVWRGPGSVLYRTH